MSKEIYKLNKEQLVFEKVNGSFRQKWIRTLKTALVIIPLALVVNILMVKYGPAYNEMLIEKQKEQLLASYDTMYQKLNILYSQLSVLEINDDSIYRPILETAPLPKEIRDAGFGGSEKARISLFDTDIISSTAKELEILTNKINIQKESFDKIYKLVENKVKEIDCKPAIMPISPRKFGRISDYFGRRSFHPVTGKRNVAHEGIDMTGPIGSLIHAPGDGKVVRSEWVSGYGWMIEIDHGFKLKSRYGHLSEMLVKKGDKVVRGQAIAKLGNTGRSTGPHLHYEVKLNNFPLNPLNFYNNDLSEKEYDEMIDYLCKIKK